MKPPSIHDGLAVFDHGGTGDVVVLLHPGNMDHRCWDTVVTASPFTMPSTVGAPRLVAYDRRGYGASASLHGAADHVADLKQAVDTLGVGRVFLVGNSPGAGIACQFALHWPDGLSAWSSP